MYTFTTYQFENCIQYSSVVWLDEKVSFVISYFFWEIIDYTTNIIWRLMYYCFFQSYQAVRYNEIFQYYLEIIWYEITHQQIENMMSKSKKKKKRKMTTRDQRWQLIIRERLSLIRRLFNFWKRFWLSRHHCRTASYWSSATWTWKHKKKRYWLNTVCFFYTWSSAIGRYQIRILHETRLLNRIQFFKFSSVLI